MRKQSSIVTEAAAKDVTEIQSRTGQRLRVKTDIQSLVISIAKSSAIDAINEDIVHRNVVSNMQNATTVKSGDRFKKHVT